MMKLIQVLAIVFVTTTTFGQRDLTPTRKKDAFGSRDFRKLGYTGLQFQLGATYLITQPNNKTVDVATTTDGFRGNYTLDPFGKLGAYAEIGLIHFPKKRSKLSLALKTVLASYYDWGLGFKYFRGGENMTVNFIDAGGVTTSTAESTSNFSNGNIYGRFSIHKNIHLGEKKNFFLDNSVGVNFDYRVMTKTDPYAMLPMTANAHYYQPFHAQLHYGLGFGFKLKRGAYLIPGLRSPILGMYEWNKGRPTLRWFSSDYWPLLIHIKYMFVFEKKTKGCPPVEINDQDKDTQRNR